VSSIRIGEYQDRLVEDADEVLAVPRVDAGLAADGGIDLREQRGRYLHMKRRTAARDTGGKAGEIADDAAAERHDRVVALDAGGEHAVADADQVFEALRLLAGRQHERDGLDALRLQRGHEIVEIEGGDMRVCDDGDLAALEAAGDLAAGGGDEAGANQDIIGTVAQIDPDGTAGVGRCSRSHCHLVRLSWQRR
jgi:hypothetical protein